MAGSLNHIVDDETGEFKMDTIENLGDAHEALEECFNIIASMTGGDMDEVNAYLKDLRYPSISINMKMAE